MIAASLHEHQNLSILTIIIPQIMQKKIYPTVLKLLEIVNIAI